MLADRMLTAEEGKIPDEHWKAIEELYRRIGVQADIVIERRLTAAERGVDAAGTNSESPNG